MPDSTPSPSPDPSPKPAIEHWEDLSLLLEQVTGYDSIPTIERVYNTSDSGAYLCVFPGCAVARRHAESLWKHLHFGPHGLSFGMPADYEALCAHAESLGASS